jgi:murein DD-endopeptidase MepM/ murein hydrolase activator NlpD
MQDYLRRFLIAGIMALCVSLLFLVSKPQASGNNLSVNWIWPTDGVISDTYGTRLGQHKGIDIAGNLNTPIVAVDDGVVAKSYYSDTYGHVVFIKHSNDIETVYAHLNKRNVTEGQSVQQGETIGYMGNTGESKGVHLHFEAHQYEWTYEKDNALNPTVLLGAVGVGENVQAFSENHAHYVVKSIKEPELETLNSLEYQGKEASTHKVQFGETLWSIAKQYSTSIASIQKVNQLTTTDIFQNQILKIPSDVKKIYVVKKGDTLSAISKKVNRSVKEIKTFNQLQTDEIYPHQEINIPVK